MPIKTIATQTLPVLNLRLVISEYETAGEYNEVVFAEPVSNSNYFLRTIILSGALQIDFPGTSEASAFTSENGGVGAIFPGDRLNGKSQIKATALIDGTTFCCVQPLPDYRIIAETKELDAGEVLSVPQGRVLFVFGSDYVVNDKASLKDDLYALVNSAAEIQAVQPCKVVNFIAIPRSE